MQGCWGHALNFSFASHLLFICSNNSLWRISFFFPFFSSFICFKQTTVYLGTHWTHPEGLYERRQMSAGVAPDIFLNFYWQSGFHQKGQNDPMRERQHSRKIFGGITASQWALKPGSTPLLPRMFQDFFCCCERVWRDNLLLLSSYVAEQSSCVKTSKVNTDDTTLMGQISFAVMCCMLEETWAHNNSNMQTSKKTCKPLKKTQTFNNYHEAHVQFLMACLWRSTASPCTWLALTKNTPGTMPYSNCKSPSECLLTPSAGDGSDGCGCWLTKSVSARYSCGSLVCARGVI